jgi:hypothetical protein
MSEKRKKLKLACYNISPMKSTLKTTDPGFSNQRKKKAKGPSYKSTPVKHVSEATDHNGLYETPKTSRASFLNMNSCTSRTSHSHWSKCDPWFHLEDLCLPISAPLVGANHEMFNPPFKGESSYSFQCLKEDEPFLRACSRESRENSYGMKNENPMEAYTYHFTMLENSRDDCFSPRTCSSINKTQNYEYGKSSRSVRDSPGASVCDLVSPQKDLFFDSPFWSRTVSYQNKFRKQMRLMEGQDEFSEFARDILSESPVLSCKKALWDHDFSSKKSQFFDFPIDGIPFSPHLDSLMTEMKSPPSLSEKDFSLWNSPITEKSDQGHKHENPLEEQNLQCYPSAHHCKVTLRPRRSSSAPPFYKGKFKFSYLNDQLATMTEEDSTFDFFKTTTG